MIINLDSEYSSSPPTTSTTSIPYFVMVLVLFVVSTYSVDPSHHLQLAAQPPCCMYFLRAEYVLSVTLHITPVGLLPASQVTVSAIVLRTPYSVCLSQSVYQ